VAILPPGLLIIAAILDHYGVQHVTVVAVTLKGLREGMVAAVFERGDDWWRDPAAKGPGPARGGPRRP
jgi:hypothetical protein